MYILEERKQKYKKSAAGIRTHVIVALSVVDKIVKLADNSRTTEPLIMALLLSQHKLINWLTEQLHVKP
jgi:hypothetical protein